MIFVECHADSVLVQNLTSLSPENIPHDLRGRGAVCNLLSNSSNSKGLIDKDPGTARHPYEKAGQPRGSHVQEDIELLHYSSQNNQLIVLCPKLEDWILKTAHIAGIDVTRRGLPNNANQLHKVIDNKLDKFRILLNMLKKRKSPRILALANLLTDLQ